MSQELQARQLPGEMRWERGARRLVRVGLPVLASALELPSI